MVASEEQFTLVLNPEFQDRSLLDSMRGLRDRLAVPAAVLGVAGLAVLGSFSSETAPADAADAAVASPSPESGTLPAIGPPFYGRSRLGHTYRSTRLRPGANSYDDMMDYYGDSLYHPYPAIDFKVPVGRDVLAVTSGTIAISSEETEATPDAWPRRPGMFILLDPDDPRLPNFAFKHLSEADVTEGQHVNRGQVIGESGSTQSPNAHLHFDAHQTVEGFNTYENQADYGRISFWQCGRQVTLSITSAVMNAVINPQPTRAASIRNCGLRIVS